MYKIPSPKGEITVYDSMEEFRNRPIYEKQQTDNSEDKGSEAGQKPAKKGFCLWHKKARR